MTSSLNKRVFLVIISMTLWVRAESDCDAMVKEEPVGCSLDNILNPSAQNNFPIIKEEVKAQNINISHNLRSLKVLHNKQKVFIERRPKNEAQSCPPFCIEPLNIEGVRTVAELETLDFIEQFNEKKARLLIDVRENPAYQKHTIPSAINLPYSMLKDESEHQEKVLKLLGGSKKVTRKGKTKWQFSQTVTLLIFGKSAIHNEASLSVKKLLELGYPSSKILYYRGGIEAWKMMGLSVI